MTTRSSNSGAAPVSRAVKWFLGIVGAIAAFMGLFILFGGEDQFVGLGGDWSWRVGDISSAWAYGLLIGGGVLLAVSLTMAMFSLRRGAAEPNELVNLLWHAGVFVLVNALVWAQDIAIGGGVDYAYLMTIPWAIGLGIHAMTYTSERRGTGGRPLPH